MGVQAAVHKSTCVFLPLKGFQKIMQWFFGEATAVCTAIHVYEQTISGRG